MQSDLPTFHLDRTQSLVSGARLNRNLPGVRGAVGGGVIARVEDGLAGRGVSVLLGRCFPLVVDGLVACGTAGVGGKMGFVAVAASNVRAHEVRGLYLLPVLALFQTKAASHIVFFCWVASGSALEASGFTVEVGFVELETSLALVKDNLFLPRLGGALDAEQREDVTEDVPHDLAVWVFNQEADGGIGAIVLLDEGGLAGPVRALHVCQR